MYVKGWFVVQWNFCRPRKFYTQFSLCLLAYNNGNFAFVLQFSHSKNVLSIFLVLLLFSNRVKLKGNFFKEICYSLIQFFVVVIPVAFLSCKLAPYEFLFTYPPIHLHAPFPWDVAKKCHSASNPESPSWFNKFAKWNLFFYWDPVPSEK